MMTPIIATYPGYFDDIDGGDKEQDFISMI